MSVAQFEASLQQAKDRLAKMEDILSMAKDFRLQQFPAITSQCLQQMADEMHGKLTAAVTSELYADMKF